MAPGRKKVRVISQSKKSSKYAKKKTASDGISKARKSLEDARDIKAQREARRKELQNALAAASGEDANAMKMEIDSIENELQQHEQKLQAAQAEEARFKKDEEDADNETEYSDGGVEDDFNMDDVLNSPEPVGGGYNPDQLKPSVETETEQGIDPADIVEKLLQGVHMSDPAEVTDITSTALLRHKQMVTCYKDGFGDPAIVVDCEIPKWTIYRIRRDVLIPKKCPNLMTWRRAGVVKDSTTKKKWSVDDIAKVLAIAIEVPVGYEKEPEELVKLIPKLSGTEKDKLKKKGKRIPKQPDVQLLILWKDGVKVPGEPKERVTSWESRSGCRTLWKKHRIADAFLLEVAIKREKGYRNAGGKHSSELRSMSPFDIPRAGSTAGPESEEEATENELTENEETSDEKEKEKEKEKERKKKKNGDERKQKREEKEKEKKEKEEKEKEEKEKEEKEKEEKEKEEKKKEEKEKKEKEKKDETVDYDLAYKTALKAFDPKFRMVGDIEANAQLTATQKGEMIESFEAYWEKKQAK